MTKFKGYDRYVLTKNVFSGFGAYWASVCGSFPVIFNGPTFSIVRNFRRSTSIYVLGGPAVIHISTVRGEPPLRWTKQLPQLTSPLRWPKFFAAMLVFLSIPFSKCAIP